MYPTTGVPYSRRLPQPPRLHWGFVLLFNIITLGIFEPFWLIVQANWVRKVLGKSTAKTWAIVYAGLFPALFIAIICLGVGVGISGQPVNEFVEPLTTFFRIAVVVSRLIAIYTLRSELEQSPINILTGGVMTFFFGSTYFQYHLHDFVLDDDRRSADGTLGLSY